MQAESPAKAGFKRPLRLPNEESVVVVVTQGEGGARAALDIAVEMPSQLSEADERSLREQARRFPPYMPQSVNSLYACAHVVVHHLPAAIGGAMHVDGASND